MVVWRDALRDGAIAFVILAALPRRAYRMLVPTRLGPRGLLAHIAFNTAVGFVLRAWVLPYVKRIVEARELAEEQLRQQLGREPTERELFEHLGIPWKE